MKKLKKAMVGVAVTVASCAVKADSCIISGSTERDCVSSAYTVDVDLVMGYTTSGWSIFGDSLEFDSHRWWELFGTPLKRFRSNPPRGFVIHVR